MSKKPLPPPPSPSNERLTETVVMEARRNVVAHYLMQGRSLTWIAEQLPKEKTPLLNSEGKPYSITTISTDAKAIRQEWRNARDKDIGDVIGHELAKLTAIEQSAWSQTPPDYRALLMAMTQRAKLLGLDFDTRQEMLTRLQITPDALAAMRALDMTTLEATNLFNQFLVRLAKRHADFDSDDYPQLTDGD